MKITNAQYSGHDQNPRGPILVVRNRVGYYSVLGLFSETDDCDMKKDESDAADPSKTSRRRGETGEEWT